MKEAFVYCWTDHKTSKIYVGSHKGSKTDGYVCSSKLMIEQYRQRPQDFTRKILAEGNYQDIRVLESKILKCLDINCNSIYNMSVGDGKFYLKQHTQKTKEKISLSHKGLKRTRQHKDNMSLSQKGKRLSDDHRKKLSDAMSGKNHFLYGTKRSISVRKKISQSMKRKNLPHSASG